VGNKEELALSRTRKRLIDAHAEIVGEDTEPAEMQFLHSLLAQCSIPYKEPPKGTRDFVRSNGHSSLILSAGHLLDPKTQKPALQGLPFGSRPRLLLIHLCSEAVRTQNATIGINETMSAFMRVLGLAVTGGATGTIGGFKSQLNRLAAARMQLLIGGEGGGSVMNPSPVIARYDVWFPVNPHQKALWPSEVTLSAEFFESLKNHALPLDGRAIRALQGSARALDVYSWLSHRLPRVNSRGGSRVSWRALESQFGGPDTGNAKTFKRNMTTALRKVLLVYPAAKVEPVEGGLLLRRSAPPIARKLPARLSTKSC
jgi:hypothetical protein